MDARYLEQRRAFDGRVAGIFAPMERTEGTVPSHEIDELLLVSSWFTRFPKEFEQTSAFAPSNATRAV